MESEVKDLLVYKKFKLRDCTRLPKALDGNLWFNVYIIIFM